MRPAVLLVALVSLFSVVDAVSAPCAGFTDVEDTSIFCGNVAWIKNRAVTLGCRQNEYCPNEPVSRIAMAAFLNRLGDAIVPPNIVWVAPVGGSFQSIQGAIDYAAALATKARPYIVKIAPGTYFEQITVRPNVAVVGSGKKTTVIASNDPAGTVLSTFPGELRNLTIRNTADDAIGIAHAWSSDYHPATFENIEVFAITQSAVGSAIGLWHQSGNVEVKSSTLLAWGGTLAAGFMSPGGVTLTDSNASGGGALKNYGARATGGATLIRSSANGSGGTDSYGFSGVGTLTDAQLSATNSVRAYALQNTGSGTWVVNSSMSASGTLLGFAAYSDGVLNVERSSMYSYGQGTNYGVYGNSVVRVLNSRIAAEYGTENHAVFRNAGFVSVAYTWIYGGQITGAKCIGNYNLNFDPITSC